MSISESNFFLLGISKVTSSICRWLSNSPSDVFDASLWYNIRGYIVNFLTCEKWKSTLQGGYNIYIYKFCVRCVWMILYCWIFQLKQEIISLNVIGTFPYSLRLIKTYGLKPGLFTCNEFNGLHGNLEFQKVIPGPGTTLEFKIIVKSSWNLENILLIYSCKVVVKLFI